MLGNNLVCRINDENVQKIFCALQNTNILKIERSNSDFVVILITILWNMYTNVANVSIAENSHINQSSIKKKKARTFFTLSVPMSFFVEDIISKFCLAILEINR